MTSTNLSSEIAALRRMAHRRLASKRIAAMRVRIKRRLRAAGVPVDNPMVSTRGLIGLVYGLRLRTA